MVKIKDFIIGVEQLLVTDFVVNILDKTSLVVDVMEFNFMCLEY